MTAQPWEPHQDAYAMRRWAEGVSAREIATELELMGPKRSRSAIIGRLYRLGAPKRPDPKVATYQPRAKKKRPTQPKMTTRKGIRTAPRPGPQNKPGVNFAKVNALNPALMEEGRATARRTHAQAMQFVEEGAGVESLNARPFSERAYGECAWPLGPKADRSCCNPVVDTASGGFGASYCAAHLDQMLSGRQRSAKALQDVVSVVNRVERIDLTDARFSHGQSKAVSRRPGQPSVWDAGRAAA